MIRFREKIYGCLLAAATADAIGTPVETRTPELIRRDFGNGDWVKGFCETLPDAISAGMPYASVSDDFSVSYVSARHYLDNSGVIDTRSTIDALLDWKNSPETATFFDHYGGPSTRRNLARLEGKAERDIRAAYCCDNSAATNGSGMKSWIAGLFNPGNPEKAARDAVIMCMPSHPNPVSISLGCAIAAAVAAGLGMGADVSQVVEAGIKGASWGYRTADRISQRTASTPVEKRIHLAVEIGLKYGHDFDACIHEMLGCIGSGMDADESGPSAFGYLAAGGGDVMKTILLACNSGNDADTTAVMAAAMAGTLYGKGNIPEEMKRELETANPWIHFDAMADAIAAVY